MKERALVLVAGSAFWLSSFAAHAALFENIKVEGTVGVATCEITAPVDGVKFGNVVVAPLLEQDGVSLPATFDIISGIGCPDVTKLEFTSTLGYGGSGYSGYSKVNVETKPSNVVVLGIRGNGKEIGFKEKIDIGRGKTLPLELYLKNFNGNIPESGSLTATITATLLPN